jgi:hypothetical protein
LVTGPKEKMTSRPIKTRWFAFAKQIDGPKVLGHDVEEAGTP